ncbi:MAG: hypothetical protein AB7S26_18270 [Sandaracinaceae bacterium]
MGPHAGRVMEALEGVVGEDAGRAGAGRLLWQLVNEGYLDAASKPELWHVLAELADHASPKAVARWLAALDDDHAGLANRSWIEGWPAELDAVATRAYARDRAPFDEGLAQLSPKVRAGMAIVRCGASSASTSQRSFL